MKITSSRNLYLIIILFAVFLQSQNLDAQIRRNKNYEDYIKTYSALSIEHMKKYKIPASITLGQGILESGAGQSDLTRRSNNHFGIKCHKDWKGPSVTARDDLPNDCFRKYAKAEESFEDHSRFLVEKSRYSSLFSLNITDYKGWARGLQKAGYATDKAYANKLIKIIEDYELYLFDNKSNWKKAVKDKSAESISNAPRFRHTPYKTHGLIYVIAQENDSYEQIAAEFNFKLKDLLKYNEVPEGFPLQPDELVYFEKKKKKADKPYYEHVVKVGESMYSISQLYGIRVKNLYKMNKKDFEYVPVEGDVLKLR